MAQYDDLSGRIGGLEATSSHILRSVNTIETFMSNHLEKAIRTEAKVDAANKRLDVIEPIIEEYESNRDKGKGMWYVICAAWTFLSGIMGAWASKVFLP